MLAAQNATEVTLNRPQGEFLSLPHKFRAYVAGFGCLRGSTLVLTEHGPMPIREIDRPMRVLSWSDQNNRFELSLSGGAFPKGAASLYRVVTQRGEFVASGHHRVLCADGSYRRVDTLDESVKVFASSQNLLQTTLGEFPLSSHAGDPDSTQRLAGLMGRYADEARQYGQQLLLAAGIALESAQQQGGAQTSSQSCGHAGVLQGPVQEHSHQGQCDVHQHSHDSAFRNELREQGALRYERVERSERASPSSQLEQQVQPTSAARQQASKFPLSLTASHQASLSALALDRSVKCIDKRDCGHTQQAELPEKQFFRGQRESKQDYLSRSFLSPLIESCYIIAVERLNEVEPYYDLQVLDNNCYVTVDGLIHHNSGKTWVGCAGIGAHAWQHPGINMGYFAPTYPQIRDIFYPTIEEVAHAMGLRAEIREGNREVHLYNGRQYRSTTICRSMDKPGAIVGFKIGHALVDELDIMAAAKARMAWRKIMARMRYKVDGLKNGIDVTTTPEGFKFVHELFVKALREKPEMAARYGLVQASTYDNEANLPDDYIDSLLEAYPPQLIDAYLRGLFVNLTTGTVYRQFDRRLNACNDTLSNGEPLFIGMDFNVGKMSAVTHVKRDGDPRAVDEIMGGLDTPDMIRRIKERYWEYSNGDYRKTCEIRIYPDASGDSRKSVNASTTDIAQLRQAGFKVVVDASNPPVKDRVNSMNAAFCNAKGERRYKVNISACPTYTDTLEQQAWTAQGEPEKEGDKDHPNDAAGYFIAKEYLINKPKVGMKRIGGLG